MGYVNIEPSQLKARLAALSSDEKFLGGAVAAPFKQRVAETLGPSIDEDVRLHGCVNCIYRDRDMAIRGGNSDGIGAERAIKDRWGFGSIERSMVMGLGGVGKPVARELALELGVGNLIVTSRRLEDRKFADNIGAVWVPWEDKQEGLGRVNLIVNCTSLGAGNKRNCCPLSYEELERTKDDACVFDVIYDPSPSKLLEMATEVGLETLDGRSMNLFQAELAFAKCFPEQEPSITAKAMATAFATLQ
jgi:shikimate dehydrogenase